MSSYYEKMLATGEVKCIDDEIPFEIPKGWEWCRIKHICSMQAGKNISASKIFSDCSDSHPYRCVGGNGLRGYTEDFNTEGHYSIVGRQGALCGCVNIEQGKFYATEHAVVVDTYEILSPLFMYYFLTALNLNKYATATAQPGLAVSNVLEVMCPLPPLNEGERIIEKLSLLIPLIENYNVIQEKQDILNDSIKEQLKKSVLQEAIQGKLVPQLTEEGTAQDLLEQIRIEKRNLVNGGKLKKSALATSVIFRGDDNKYYTSKNKDTICIDDEIPFEIPDSWVWVRFGTIVINRDRERIPLSVAQRQFLSKRYDYYGASGVIDKVDRYLFDKELLLIGEDGANLLSRSTPIAFIAKGKYWVNNHAHVLDVYDGVMLKYIALYINSISLAPYVTGTAQPKMNQEKMNSILIALPPQKEQQRIVTQIEKLFEQLH